MAEQYIGNVRLVRRVIKGDQKAGVPDLWLGSDAGDLHYVKLWRRLANDQDIRALWNREVRGLMRLQGHPGAAELFVRLQQLGLDDRYYYAVLEGGRREPLSALLEKRHLHHWLTNLREIGRRRPIWDGLLRIAEGIVVLHREGTLHRAISPQSVFVGPDGDDFRLSGFEWSLRVAGSEGAAIKVAQSGTLLAPELERGTAEYSTASDWFAFGVLAGQLLGISPGAHRKGATFRAAVDRLDHLNGPEKEVILSMVAEDPEERLYDDAAVLRALADVRRTLNVAVLGANRPLMLAVRLGENSPLSEQIEIASQGKAVRGQPIDQLAWVNGDLRGDFRIVARAGSSPHYVLRGRQLEYRVRPWALAGGSTWDVGYCDSTAVPRIFEDDQTYSLGPRKLEVRSFAEVRNGLHSIRPRVAAWDGLFPFSRPRSVLPPHLRDVHDFFRITQQLEVALEAATICPIEIVAIDRSETGTEVVVTPRKDPDRDDLALVLRLSPPAEQLRDWFDLGVEPIDADDEEGPERDQYYLLNRRVIARDSSPDVIWSFSRARQTPSGPLYSFKCRGSPPLTPGGRMFLARNFGGTVAQIRRRNKAIENLRSHESLLRMVDDPLGASRRSDEPLPPARREVPLDPSKDEALLGMWQRQPSYAVQGPPGTGKTTLIKAFADRLLGMDGSAQVLITAHSHHTVDDVLMKLDALFQDLEPQERPILVRLGGEEHGGNTPAEVTREQLRRLEGSELALRSPPALQDRLAAIVEEADRPSSTDRELRTMQLLTQDAANLTFSTSNAVELAQLVDRGRRFDWSVIEEAGKAHGFDMALALQESHRLVLIGDHAQLPPYNAERFTRLLDDPLRVREAIRKGAAFAPNLIDASIVEEDESRPSLSDRCAKWRGMVEFFKLLFNASAGSVQGAGPSATLADQHRMHPDIADLVGRTFYPDEEGGTILKSPKETHERFSKPPPFAIREKSWLPEQRIIWCDLPWVQRELFAPGETTGLFEAPAEVEALVRVLGEIEPVPGRKCELQILSPYNGQLGAIRRRLGEERQAGRLAHMFADPFDLTVRKRMGATVDEFQGSEADVVVVSLVRNNGLPARKSLGFLRQPNRLNVLLSRARHKLVIIGSWDFFATRCTADTSPYEEYAYVGRMMTAMARSEAAGLLARVRMQP